MNDRRITERLLHDKLMLIVVSEGVDYDKYPIGKTIEGLLMKDMDDALSGMSPDRAEKLLARSSRALGKATRERTREGSLVAKFGLSVFYLLRNLVDQGYVGFENDSPFTLALETILPALEEHTVEVNLDKSAQKQARRLFEALKREGYYDGANWSDA